MTIRMATPADAPAIQSIYAHYVEHGVASFEYAAPSVDAMAERVAATLPQWPWLVYSDAAGVRGYAYAGSHSARSAYQWSVNVSVYLEHGLQRRGLGRQLYTVLLELLRQQGFYTAFAGVTLPNPASVGLHEALGFTPVGIYHNTGYKMGAWHAVGWWELTLQPYPETPQPPRTLAELGLLEARW